MNAIVIVPTYNERENLRPLVNAVLDQGEEFEVLVVDDNSPDGTGDLADELAAENPRVHVYHRLEKLGLGTAYREAFEWGIKRGYDFILSMDSDFSHDPADLPRLLRAARDADLVIGSRYVVGGGSEGWPLRRIIVSRAANLFSRLVLGLRPRDCSAGFRCYRREVLERIGPESIQSKGYSLMEEMTLRVQQAGFRIAEVPIIFRNREVGSSKISIGEAFRSLFLLLRLRILR